MMSMGLNFCWRRFEEFEADGHEGFAFFEAVGDVEGHVAAVFQDAVEFGDDLGHGGVVGVGGLSVDGCGVEFADASWVVGVIDVGGVGGVDEGEVDGIFGEGDVARVGLLDVLARGGEVEGEGLAEEFGGDVEGGAAAAHGVEDGVAFSRVA